MKNVPYVASVACLSLLFFIISGIQYWVSDYFITVIGTPQETVFVYFSITAITAPILGAVLSSILSSRLGGYEGKYTLRTAIIAAILSVISAILVPPINEFNVLVALIWILLFMGGYILPLMTATMLMQVENDQKALANSIANFCYNFFGYMPAPVIYGAVSSLDIGDKSKWGMIVLMYATIPSCICLITVYFTRKKPSSSGTKEPLLCPPQLRKHSFENYDLNYNFGMLPSYYLHEANEESLHSINVNRRSSIYNSDAGWQKSEDGFSNLKEVRTSA